jgi:hypothetical protein
MHITIIMSIKLGNQELIMFPNVPSCENMHIKGYAITVYLQYALSSPKLKSENSSQSHTCHAEFGIYSGYLLILARNMTIVRRVIRVCESH